MQDSILYNCFTTSHNTHNHFPRPRIDKLLKEASEYDLIGVTAGAGWGKTQAVTSFIHQSDMNFAWLQFSKLDNYTVRFWENFTHAVSLQIPVLAYRLASFGFPNSPALFHNFLHIFADMTVDIDKLVLIFDDVHLINDLSIKQFFENLLYARLKNVTVILIGRTIPDLDLQELHINDTAYQITEEILRFTKQEAGAYFKGQGITFPKDIFENIYAGTEGWISALYLIGVSIKKNGSSSQNMLSIAKQQIFELIEQEIFSQYSEETQHVLVKLALLERIPIDFVKKHSKSHLSLLKEIEKTNRFIRLNHLTKTYDIHHLFLEFLLEKQDMYLTGEELKVIYFNVADWYDTHGFKIEALTYYQKCEHYKEIWGIIRQYEMLVPVTEGTLFLNLVESFPKDLTDNNPLISVMHARLLMITFKMEECLQEFTEIVNKYEAMPPTGENKAVIGEVYIYLGMLSLLSFDYKFVDYFKKASEYLPNGSSLIDNRYGFCHGYFMVLVKEPAPDEISKFVNATMEAMPYGSIAMNGAGYGVEYVTKAEADYYTGNMKEAESAAYKAIYQSEQKQQYDTMCAAYYILIRVYISEGNYSKVADYIGRLEKKIEALKSDSEKVSYIKSYVYTYTVLKSWYYARIGCLNKIPDWILKKEARHKVHSNSYYPNDDFIHAYCLLENQNYYELSGLLATLEGYYNESGMLFAQLYVQILKAILAHKAGSVSNAMEALGYAYNLAYANSIFMPFIEFGEYMQSLIYTAKRSKENTVPEAWLSEMYTKARAYEKHLNNVKLQYQRVSGQVMETYIQFTNREKEMLKYLCQGLTGKEMASTLYVSLSAVKKTLNLIYAKMGAANKADAVRLAVQKGLHK